MPMTLFHSPTSPFVRKVVIAAIETGQDSDLERTPANPQGDDAALKSANAISKVPAMITDDGVALPESDKCCLYIDERDGSGKLIPKSGAARWRTFRQEALADGFMEAAVGRRGFAMLPDGERSQDLLDKLMDRMLRILDAMEAEAGDLEGFDLGAISIACACGYADFRYGDLAWREGRPKLAAFYESASKRASMQSTQPPQ